MEKTDMWNIEDMWNSDNCTWEISYLEPKKDHFWLNFRFWRSKRSKMALLRSKKSKMVSLKRFITSPLYITKWYPLIAILWFLWFWWFLVIFVIWAKLVNLEVQNGSCYEWRVSQLLDIVNKCQYLESSLKQPF